MPITIHVNGEQLEVRADERMPLLWLLRCDLKLIGTKFGCGIGVCGACAVHINGELKMSCRHNVGTLDGKEIVTIEGLDGREASALRAAWLNREVIQCGYCQNAQMMAAAALLKSTPNPSEMEIIKHMSCVICRCGTYTRIACAVADAAQTLKVGPT